MPEDYELEEVRLTDPENELGEDWGEGDDVEISDNQTLALAFGAGILLTFWFLNRRLPTAADLRSQAIKDQLY